MILFDREGCGKVLLDPELVMAVEEGGYLVDGGPQGYYASWLGGKSSKPATVCVVHMQYKRSFAVRGTLKQVSDRLGLDVEDPKESL